MATPLTPGVQLHLVPDDVDRVRPGLHPRAVGPRPVGEAEPPVVPRARHAPVLDVPAGERRPHVRAQVVDGEELPVHVEHRHVLLPDRDDRTPAVGDVRHLPDRDPLAHARILPPHRCTKSDDAGIVPSLPAARGAGRARSRSPVPHRRPRRASSPGSSPGGRRSPQDRTDVDLYFNAPDRDLKATDEAFRLRRIGDAELPHLQGAEARRRDQDPHRDRGPARRRRRGGGRRRADARSPSGYRPVVTVRKKRQVYRFARGGFAMEACFDDVELVGPFVELEILAPEEQYEPAKAVLLPTAAELGLTEKETRRTSGWCWRRRGERRIRDSIARCSTLAARCSTVLTPKSPWGSPGAQMLTHPRPTAAQKLVINRMPNTGMRPP